MYFTDDYRKPIPVSNHFQWVEVKKVKIEESGEKLLSLNLIPEKFIKRKSDITESKIIVSYLSSCRVYELSL